MRTLLVNLPWRVNGRLGVRAGSRWPFTCNPEKDGKIRYIPFPFFLAYATSLLKKNNKEARLIDAVAEEINEAQFNCLAKAYKPELILAETSTPSFYNDIAIAEDLKKDLSNPRIALCGPHASVLFKEILEKYGFIDYIFIGEYEKSLFSLVDALEKGRDLASIPGLAFRQNGSIKINKQATDLTDLDSLPWPEREDLPIYKYNDGFCGLPTPNVQMWSTRGCPYKCNFCLWPQTMYKGYGYRKRNPVKVAEEAEYLIRKYDFQAIYFDDDIFNLDKKHVLEICNEFKKRQIKKPWAAMARLDLMDKALLKKMRSSGLYAIKYGIESANKGILNLSRKEMDLSLAIPAIELTGKLGIKVHLSFCLGLPGETKETLRQTVDFIHKAKADSFQVSLATPLPGTEYYNSLKQNKESLSQDWADYDGNSKYAIRMSTGQKEDLEKTFLEIKAICNEKSGWQ